jgi:hypothetical protein
MIQTSQVRAGWSKVLLPGFLLAALVAATCLLYLSVPARQAQEVSDAGCPIPSDARASVSARTAQSFTAVDNGRLTSAQALVANGNRTGSSDDYVLSINEVDAAGVPTSFGSDGVCGTDHNRHSHGPGGQHLGVLGVQGGGNAVEMRRHTKRLGDDEQEDVG